MNSISVVVGDFNTDGKLDIAVSNGSSNTVGVFLGKGDGTFQAPVVTNIQNAISIGELVTGDFNEDGKPDLILATVAGPQTDLVLIGNGDGTFQTQVPIPNTFGFLSARVVDLNGDKHLDFVAAVPGTVVNVFLGNGDGTFSQEPDLSFGSNGIGLGFGIEVNDFNADKKTDVVVADFSNSQLDYFVGNGDGTFQPPTSVSTMLSEPSSLASADFNGDGKPDLLIGYTLGSASLVLGIGNGTFQLSGQSTLYAEGSGNGTGVAVKSADLNLDGKPDALIADYRTGAFVVVVNSAGTVSSSSSTTFSFNASPGIAELAVGDLNGDGIPDVVLVNNKTNQLSLFLSQKT